MHNFIISLQEVIGYFLAYQAQLNLVLYCYTTKMHINYNKTTHVADQ